MRSSKQRSRSKPNRNRSVGNVVNRVFDSSGPEGKVRGTPQQIIDKYNQLARDAQLSGDRVATENFQQHSEHYTRMLAEATREQEARREAQEAQQRERQQHNNQNNQRNDQPQQRDDRGDRNDRGGERNNRGDRGQGNQLQPDNGPQPDLASQPQPSAPEPEQKTEQSGVSDVIDMGSDDDSGLVETPESKPAPKPRTRRPRKPAAEKPAKAAVEKPAAEPVEKAAAPEPDGDGPAEAAE